MSSQPAQINASGDAIDQAFIFWNDQKLLILAFDGTDIMVLDPDQQASQRYGSSNKITHQATIHNGSKVLEFAFQLVDCNGQYLRCRGDSRQHNDDVAIANLLRPWRSRSVDAVGFTNRADSAKPRKRGATKYIALTGLAIVLAAISWLVLSNRAAHTEQRPAVTVQRPRFRQALETEVACVANGNVKFLASAGDTVAADQVIAIVVPVETESQDLKEQLRFATDQQKRNDLNLRQYDEVIEKATENLESLLSVTVAKLKKANAEQARLQAKLTHLQPLIDKGSLSETELDALTSELAVATAETSLLEAHKRRLDLQLTTLTSGTQLLDDKTLNHKIQLVDEISKTDQELQRIKRLVNESKPAPASVKIRAPCAGMITNTLAKSESVVQSGTRLLSIRNEPQPVIVEGVISLALADGVFVGSRVKIEANDGSAASAKSYDGKVTAISIENHDSDYVMLEITVDTDAAVTPELSITTCRVH